MGRCRGGGRRLGGVGDDLKCVCDFRLRKGSKKAAEVMQGSEVSLCGSGGVGEDVSFGIVARVKEPGMGVGKTTSASSREVSSRLCWCNVLLHEKAESPLPCG